MKNLCDICHNDFAVLVSVQLYDKNFAPGTVVKQAKICKSDLAKL